MTSSPETLPVEMPPPMFRARVLPLTLLSALLVATTVADEEADYYRIETVQTSRAETDSRSKAWKPGDDGPALEVSGLATLSDGRIAVATRRGEIWIGTEPESRAAGETSWQRFASGLHEPLGLHAVKEGVFLTVQRTELTRVADTDDDGIADRFDTVATGWGVTGNYHEYAYGPKQDGEGNLWLTLNCGLGLKAEHKSRVVTDPLLKVAQGKWRGWGLRVTPDGTMQPMCAGMRSPAGLGANAEGDMFYSEQQGNWVPTNALHHMREGVFFHHPQALASQNLPGSPITGVTSIPGGLLYPKALAALPVMRPPAVWLPYRKVGQSPTDILLDQSDGKFGPFAGQLFVGEFTLASINRVFLEKVDGEYQGVCFPFRSGFASAVLRLAQSPGGDLNVGLSNRGWSSLGTASYGLQRLVWTKRVPFEIREMRARPNGFELRFTLPVDPVSGGDPESYRLRSHTYLYHETYGSDEIDARTLTVREAIVSGDRKSVRLRVDGLRPLYVHELRAEGVRSAENKPLLHADAYYTLNRIPEADAE